MCGPANIGDGCIPEAFLREDSGCFFEKQGFSFHAVFAFYHALISR